MHEHASAEHARIERRVPSIESAEHRAPSTEHRAPSIEASSIEHRGAEAPRPHVAHERPRAPPHGNAHAPLGRRRGSQASAAWHIPPLSASRGSYAAPPSVVASGCVASATLHDVAALRALRIAEAVWRAEAAPAGKAAGLVCAGGVGGSPPRSVAPVVAVARAVCIAASNALHMRSASPAALAAMVWL